LVLCGNSRSAHVPEHMPLRFFRIHPPPPHTHTHTPHTHTHTHTLDITRAGYGRTCGDESKTPTAPLGILPMS
jgi:hypothetical protein